MNGYKFALVIFFKDKSLKSELFFDYKGDKHNIISFNPQINKETKRIKVDKADITTNTKTIEKGTGSNTDTVYNREDGAKPTETSDTPILPTGHMTDSGIAYTVVK